jgi:hypothetical protein
MRNWNNYTGPYTNNNQNYNYSARPDYSQARLWGKTDALYTPTKFRK